MFLVDQIVLEFLERARWAGLLACQLSGSLGLRELSLTWSPRMAAKDSSVFLPPSMSFFTAAIRIRAIDSSSARPIAPRKV